jgi:hypothetical protein
MGRRECAHAARLHPVPERNARESCGVRRERVRSAGGVALHLLRRLRGLVTDLRRCLRPGRLHFLDSFTGVILGALGNLAAGRLELIDRALQLRPGTVEDARRGERKVGG